MTDWADITTDQSGVAAGRGDVEQVLRAGVGWPRTSSCGIDRPRPIPGDIYQAPFQAGFRPGETAAITRLTRHFGQETPGKMAQASAFYTFAV